MLKVGQKVFVLNNETEIQFKCNKDFQIKRLYIISQFEYQGNKIILNYHMEARQENEIDRIIKEAKNNILRPYEQRFNITEIKPNENITNTEERHKDYLDRLYDFSGRLKGINEFLSIEQFNLLKNEIKEFKTMSSKCNDNNPVPILGLTSTNWIFLLEKEDFEMNLKGEVIFH